MRRLHGGLGCCSNSIKGDDLFVKSLLLKTYMYEIILSAGQLITYGCAVCKCVYELLDSYRRLGAHVPVYVNMTCGCMCICVYELLFN